MFSILGLIVGFLSWFGGVLLFVGAVGIGIPLYLRKKEQLTEEQRHSHKASLLIIIGCSLGFMSIGQWGTATIRHTELQKAVQEIQSTIKQK